MVLDQVIECTINKHGKSKGGINGLLNEYAIDELFFSFRAIVSSSLHEICGSECAANSINSHMRCSDNRKVLDEPDLCMIFKNLLEESLFCNG